MKKTIKIQYRVVFLEEMFFDVSIVVRHYWETAERQLQNSPPVLG